MLNNQYKHYLALLFFCSSWTLQGKKASTQSSPIIVQTKKVVPVIKTDLSKKASTTSAKKVVRAAPIVSTKQDESVQKKSTPEGVDSDSALFKKIFGSDPTDVQLHDMKDVKDAYPQFFDHVAGLYSRLNKRFWTPEVLFDFVLFTEGGIADIGQLVESDKNADVYEYAQLYEQLGQDHQTFEDFASFVSDTFAPQDLYSLVKFLPKDLFASVVNKLVRGDRELLNDFIAVYTQFGQESTAQLMNVLHDIKAEFKIKNFDSFVQEVKRTYQLIKQTNSAWTVEQMADMLRNAPDRVDIIQIIISGKIDKHIKAIREQAQEHSRLTPNQEALRDYLLLLDWDEGVVDRYIQAEDADAMSNLLNTIESLPEDQLEYRQMLEVRLESCIRVFDEIYADSLRDIALSPEQLWDWVKKKYKRPTVDSAGDYIDPSDKRNVKAKQITRIKSDLRRFFSDELSRQLSGIDIMLDPIQINLFKKDNPSVIDGTYYLYPDKINKDAETFLNDFKANPEKYSSDVLSALFEQDLTLDQINRYLFDHYRWNLDGESPFDRFKHFVARDMPVTRQHDAFRLLVDIAVRKPEDKWLLSDELTDLYLDMIMDGHVSYDSKVVANLAVNKDKAAIFSGPSGIDLAIGYYIREHGKLPELSELRLFLLKDIGFDQNVVDRFTIGEFVRSVQQAIRQEIIRGVTPEQQMALQRLSDKYGNRLLSFDDARSYYDQNVMGNKSAAPTQDDIISEVDRMVAEANGGQDTLDLRSTNIVQDIHKKLESKYPMIDREQWQEYFSQGNAIGQHIRSIPEDLAQANLIRDLQADIFAHNAPRNADAYEKRLFEEARNRGTSFAGEFVKRHVELVAGFNIKEDKFTRDALGDGFAQSVRENLDQAQKEGTVADRARLNLQAKDRRVQEDAVREREAERGE